MPIEGIAAHIALVDRSTLRIADEQSANLPGLPSGTALKSDFVALSGAARALLALASTENTLSATGTVLSTNDASPGNLIRANFTNQDFSGTDLTGAVLKSADLTNADFSNAVLRDALLTNAVVTGATFFGADLRGANLAGARGLTADQLVGARIDIATILPVGVQAE